jgi:hypothetical protein
MPICSVRVSAASTAAAQSLIMRRVAAVHAAMRAQRFDGTGATDAARKVSASGI